MTKEELKVRIEAELLTGKTPKELADKYSVPYITVLSWQKKLELDKPNEDISVLTSNTIASLEVIKDVAKREAPVVASKIEKIVDGAIALKKLEPAFAEALETAVEVAIEFLNEKTDEGKTALSVKEWQMVTSTLAATYSAIYNKTGTTVNVAQTNVTAEGESLAFFKASQKAL